MIRRGRDPDAMRALLLLAALLAAGCAQPPAPAPEGATVDPPADQGEHRPCPPTASQSLAFPFRAQAVADAQGRAPGIHRLDAERFLWVYASYRDTLREDRVTRVNEVNVARVPSGDLVICTRVDISAPIEVDAQARTYDVAVLLSAQEPLPRGALDVYVNWIAGCPCDPLPRGVANATFVEG